MPGLHHPCSCKPLNFLNLSCLLNFTVPFKIIQKSTTISSSSRCPVSINTPNFFPVSMTGTRESSVFSTDSLIWRRTQVPFCSSNDDYTEFGGTRVWNKPENERLQEMEGIELLGKPSPLPVNGGSVTEVESESPKLDTDDALAPFLKFFTDRDSGEEAKEDSESEVNIGEELESQSQKVRVNYYEPKPGDLVVGVVVSGNENKLDVNIGADLLGTMLTKEVLPLYDQEFPYLLCDMRQDAEEFMVSGKMGIVWDEDAVSGDPVPGRPVVEVGTVLFAEVLGRTLSGRPLLSTRRLFRRVAWHRVRQIKHFNEPIEVRITEWNTGGLLARIEGLRAFLPKGELMGRVNTFTDLKENVGRRMFVLFSRIDEPNNDLIISEKEAWALRHLQDGTLLDGTVKKIFPYGAQIRIGETNRSGLLHISRITHGRIGSVGDFLTVGENVKVLVVKSMFSDKISLSIANLESEPGLFLSNKERVFSEAEEMAKKYRQKLPVVSATRKLDDLPTDVLPFDDEARLYSNWKWFKFGQDNASN
ncbi:protein PIGMENT DEFECTIVE 338, chloroplastic-like [Macadamia integrifolia]|uniref:protein PIGMENT DEFECTIVE 338, chloroplastic-like n=1 Tax=Macadamia integrifolia TaxID=60698 RepID=UPI001C4EDA34|nr:protein PIGMENT DEFECTIVE 338, chloroplastic-like [Macadamia integrifolia]